MAERTKIIALVLGAAILLSACGDALGDKYVGFAKCLKDKGVVMYGAYWCPHCANQKKRFGGAGYAALNYVECDPRGVKGNPQLCLEKGIKGYPTWDFPDGTREEGEMELAELAEKSQCELPKEPDTPPPSGASIN